jgi:hypothetical protein
MANLVDYSSVSLIEGMLPRKSLDDQSHITQLIDTNQLFPYITNPTDRASLKPRILALEGRITSLNTLAQDILYIENPTMALHHLCPRKFDGTLMTQMRRQWKSIGKRQAPEIQVSEHSFKPIPNSRRSFMSSMIQLWLFSLRHFVYHSPTITASRAYETPNQALTFRALAALANRLGFSSDAIDKIQTKNQSRVIAQNFVDEISRDEFLNLKESHVKAVSNRFAAIMTSLRGNKAIADYSAKLSTDDPEESAQRRFNRPVLRQYNEQRGNIFMEQIFSSVESPARFPTSLAITRDILICFFGTTILSEINTQSELCSDAAENEMVGSSPIDANAPAEKETSIVETNEDNSGGGPDPGLECESSPHHAPLPESPIEESIERSPVSLPPHPSGTPDDMTWESQPPMAAGFEDLLNIGGLKSKIHMAHHRKIPEILSMWHQSNNQSLVVIYLFEDRTFYKFRATDSFALRSFLTDLARDFTLMEIHTDYGLSIPDMNKICETALSNHLIVAARKGNPSHKKPQGAEMSLDEFRNYVQNYDVHTGKRSGEDGTGRPAKRR